MKYTQSRELYNSPNGDRWHLCKDASGRVFVLHQANIPSGGRTSQIELGDFLTKGYGPEQQALVQMIGTLIVSTPGELLTGEGNPGLAVSGGSGHAETLSSFNHQAPYRQSCRQTGKSETPGEVGRL